MTAIMHGSQHPYPAEKAPNGAGGRPAPVNAAGTSAAELAEVFAAQNAQFAASAAPTLAERRHALLALERAVLRHREEFAEAAVADFGSRSIHETEVAEVIACLGAIRYLRRHLRAWMKPRRRSTPIWFQPGRSRLIAQPKGVVGVISPWNFPLALTVVPVATAIAAGNRVMVKTSEFTPATTAVLIRVFAEEFPPEAVHVCSGDATLGQAFAELPFAHLFFTGSSAVGKSVAMAAARNLTPVTLELGGKSPVIIDRGYNLEAAAKSVAWGKLCNGGQVCVAPDYVLVPDGLQEEFGRLVQKAAREMYPRIEGNQDYTSAIHDGHFARLQELVRDAETNGASVIVAADDPTEGAGERKLPLNVIIDPDQKTRVRSEEIFGPILPVLGYRDLNEAIHLVNANERPLALYLFTKDAANRKAVLERTTSGGVTVNDTLLHYLIHDLPFGGVGGSGMGSYHGREGFDTFSHLKPVFHQRSIAGRTGVQLLYPPYKPIANHLIRLMRRF